MVVWDFFHQPYIRHFFSHTSAAFGGGGFFFADSLPRCWGIVMCWSTYLGINTLKQTTFFPHKKKTTLPETNSKFAPENRPGLPKRKQSYSNHIPTHQGEENTYSSHQGVDNPFFWGVSKYIYIYIWYPPPRPILSQNLLVFALFCCFLLCLNVFFFGVYFICSKSCVES